MAQLADSLLARHHTGLIRPGDFLPGLFSLVMNKGKRIVVAVLLAFAVSTTSVSCLPYCPNKGAPSISC